MIFNSLTTAKSYEHVTKSGRTVWLHVFDNNQKYFNELCGLNNDSLMLYYSDILFDYIAITQQLNILYSTVDKDTSYMMPKTIKREGEISWAFIATCLYDIGVVCQRLLIKRGLNKEATEIFDHTKFLVAIAQ